MTAIEYAVACEGKPTTWHATKAEALAEVDDLTARGFAPVVYRVPVEVEA